MKKIISAIVYLLCAIPSIAQVQHKPEWKELVGTWRGYYLENGEQKSLTMVFLNNEGTCSIELPGSAVKTSACQVMVCEAGDFHITRSSLEQTFTFVGKPEGNTMKGKYKVGDSCAPGKQMEFSLERLP